MAKKVVALEQADIKLKAQLVDLQDAAGRVVQAWPDLREKLLFIADRLESGFIARYILKDVVPYAAKLRHFVIAVDGLVRNYSEVHSDGCESAVLGAT